MTMVHDFDEMAAMAEREWMDEQANRFAPPATMSEAHSEWHRNSGVPMGQPGCPMDACHLPEPDRCGGCGAYEGHEPCTCAPPTVKCGNKRAHGGQPGYHHTAAGVKECYAGSGRFSGPKPAHVAQVSLYAQAGGAALQQRGPVVTQKHVAASAMPEISVESAVEKMRAAQERKEREEAAAKRARYAAWRSIPVYVGGRGYYALEMQGTVHFFKVERPTEGKHAGKTFVKEQAGDAFHQMGWVRAGEVMDAIAADPGAAGALYGQHIGRCYRCHRTLTDETSRAAGIGPDCSKK